MRPARASVLLRMKLPIGTFTVFQGMTMGKVLQALVKKVVPGFGQDQKCGFISRFRGCSVLSTKFVPGNWSPFPLRIPWETMNFTASQNLLLTPPPTKKLLTNGCIEPIVRCHLPRWSVSVRIDFQKQQLAGSALSSGDFQPTHRISKRSHPDRSRLQDTPF